MQNRILLTFLFVVLLAANSVVAQLIQRYTIESQFGFSQLKNQKSQSSKLDFLNYIYPNNFEPTYWSFESRLWLNKQLEFYVEIGMYDDLAPILYDFRMTKRFNNNWGYNLGVEDKVWFMYEIEQFYTGLGNNYFINLSPDNSYNYFQYNQYNIGPYLGLDYYYENNRFSVQAMVNAGVHWNSKYSMQVNLKQKNSNYVYTQEFNTKTSTNVWVCPELYASYALVNHEKYQIGIRASCDYFFTSKTIEYILISNEWTSENEMLETVKNPSHFIRMLSIDFGLFVKIK